MSWIAKEMEPQMNRINTDEEDEPVFKLVFICVHLWLKSLFPFEIE